MVTSRQRGYGVGGPSLEWANAPIIAKRAPRTTDTNYDLGQEWLDTTVLPATAYEYLGDGVWATDSSINAYPISPYVVGPSGKAGYQTIQSALNAANAAGGGTVYVQNGTYTENLTLYDNTQVVGVSAFRDDDSAIIVGVHTPPTSGNFMFCNLTLQTATHIFSSAAAGTAHLIIANCNTVVTTGYTYNLVNWTGILEFYNTDSAGTTTDGGVNNTGGATVYAYAAGVGGGTANSMIVSGTFLSSQTNFYCPLNPQTGGNFTIDQATFARTLTFSNDSTGTISNSRLSTGATAAITMSSSAAVAVYTSVITSSNNPAIAGAGAGTLSLGDITFTSNTAISGTLTVSYVTSRLGPSILNGNLTFGTAGNKINSSNVGTTTAAGANSFGSVTLVGGTATVSTTAVTASSLIVLWRQSLGATGANPIGLLTVGTITAGTSFVINAATTASATTLVATDVSVVGWMIIN